MPPRKPTVSLRRPPAPVALDDVERFVQAAPGAPAPPAEPPRSVPPRRGARGARGLVARKDGRELRRMTVYLPSDLARELALHCAERDLDASAVVSEAVRRLLRR